MKKGLLFSVAAMLLVAFSFISCSSETPGDVAVASLEAMKSGDVAKAVSYMNLPEEYVDKTVERLAKKLARDNADNHMLKNGTFKVLSEDIDGDHATVEVEIEADGYRVTRNFVLLKVDGTWKLDSK